MNPYTAFMLFYSVMVYACQELIQAFTEVTSQCTYCGGHHPRSQCTWPLTDE